MTSLNVIISNVYPGIDFNLISSFLHPCAYNILENPIYSKELSYEILPNWKIEINHHDIEISVEFYQKKFRIHDTNINA